MTTCPTCLRRFDDGTQYCSYDGAALPGASCDPLVGTVLDGRFEVREVLGEGASGAVYRAWQASMQRWVAIKVLHPELAHDSFMVERMEREARAIARLSHAGIVAVHTSGVTSTGAPYLVMELVDGVTLEHAMEPGVPLAMARIIEVGAQIADALAESHAAGVVHRDLKPANVMLVAGRRGVDQVKVLDFGIAKLVTGGFGGGLLSGDGQLTATGAICGTPHYISPEQASGEAVDARADLYSLGVVLYRMATGVLPFDGNPVAVLLGHVQDAPPPPRGVADPRLASLIMRCLEKDPARRPQTADELADELRALSTSSTHGAQRFARAPTVPVSERSTVVTGEVPALTGGAVSDSDFGMPRARRGGMLAGVFAFVLALGLGAGGHALMSGQAPLDSARAAVAPPAPATRLQTSTPRAVTPDVISAPEGPPAREIVVAEGGYSMRIALPDRLLAGIGHDIVLDVWDPNGDPITSSEMILTLEDGAGASHGVAARPTRVAGQYRFDHVFDTAGVYQLRVYPPSGGAAIRVYVEAIAPGSPRD